MVEEEREKEKKPYFSSIQRRQSFVGKEKKESGFEFSVQQKKGGGGGEGLARVCNLNWCS